MAAVGVICEYNPFHNGHAYHLRQSRKAAGENGAVLCVMSGDFVQRGEAAVYSKFARAEMACRCGADLVVELPLPWCLSSAERFAAGAVDLLGKLGADTLCFGSETGDLEPLERLAAALLDPAVQASAKNRLLEQPELSYAAARQVVLQKSLGDDALLLSQPNNILAVEYLKAILRGVHTLRPLAVKRLGGGHDAVDTERGFRSASEIRRMLRAGEDICEEMPQAAFQILLRERELGKELSQRQLETAVLSRLRMLKAGDFEVLPDAGDGLGLRLYRAVREEGSLEAIQKAAQTKRYPLARIRRLCMCACLSVKKDMKGENPPYARILAMNTRGQQYLAAIRKKTEIPLLTKPAAVHHLPQPCCEVFELGANAHDLYVLGYQGDEAWMPGEDWRNGPVFV